MPLDGPLEGFYEFAQHARKQFIQPQWDSAVSSWAEHFGGEFCWEGMELGCTWTVCVTWPHQWRQGHPMYSLSQSFSNDEAQIGRPLDVCICSEFCWDCTVEIENVWPAKHINDILYTFAHAVLVYMYYTVVTIHHYEYGKHGHL